MIGRLLCRAFVSLERCLLVGKESTVPVLTTRYKAFIRPMYFGIYWRCEIRSTSNSELAWRGFGFTRADAERQAHAWASARL